MKNKIIVIIIPVVVGLTACKKDIGVCRDYKEVKSTSNHQMDPASLNAPELVDTLAKYPDLQLYNFYWTTPGWTARCRLWYKGLPVFSDEYALVRNTALGSFTTSGASPRVITNISTEPAVSYKDAIREARKHVNFDHTCISYELGVCNTYFNNNNNSLPKNYRLAWKITGENGWPKVLIDATGNYLITAGAGPYFW